MKPFVDSPFLEVMSLIEEKSHEVTFVNLGKCTQDQPTNTAAVQEDIPVPSLGSSGVILAISVNGIKVNATITRTASVGLDDRS